MTDELLAKNNWRGEFDVRKAYKCDDLIVNRCIRGPVQYEFYMLCRHIYDQRIVYRWDLLTVPDIIKFFDYITKDKNQFELCETLKRAVKV
jgi:hypothetical protein